MDTISSPSSHSPASVSLPVSPDDDSRFDRTASPSPAFPKETLQQCGVSRIVEIHAPVLACNTPSLLNFLEQAATLGYNTLNLTCSDPNPTLTGSDPNHNLTCGAPLTGTNPTIHIPEDLLPTSHSLGYHTTLTTGSLPLSARILQNLDHVVITIGGKPKTQHQHDTLAATFQSLPLLQNSVSSFSFSHTLLPDSWQILSWLTDLAIHHKAASLRLQTPASTTWSAIDLLRIYIAHYYLKSFAEPELIVQLDLLHRDNLINNPNFFFNQIFSKLIITSNGDILPIPQSTFFRIGNIHDRTPLSTMIDRFMEEKFGYIMQLYNDTYREIMADPGVEIFNWHQLIIDKSKKFEDIPPAQD